MTATIRTNMGAPFFSTEEGLRDFFRDQSVASGTSVVEGGGGVEGGTTQLGALNASPGSSGDPSWRRYWIRVSLFSVLVLAVAAFIGSRKKG